MDTDAGGWVSSGCPIFFFSERGNKAKTNSDAEGGGNRVLAKREEVVCWITFTFLRIYYHNSCMT